MRSISLAIIVDRAQERTVDEREINNNNSISYNRIFSSTNISVRRSCKRL